MIHDETLRAAGRPVTGWTVLFAMLAFFGVIFAVNAYFIYMAVATYTGVVSVEPYRKGLAYNDRIEAGNQQASLGWTEQVAVSVDGRVQLTLRDKSGSGLPGLKLAGTIGRPSTGQYDVRLTFLETGEGVYTAQAGALSPGNWIIAAEVATDSPGAEPSYRLRRRAWLKP